MLHPASCVSIQVLPFRTDPNTCCFHCCLCHTHLQVAIKVLNIDYDDPAGLSAETLLRFKAEVDFQRKLSHHP
jgi:hypothetical protein